MVTYADIANVMGSDTAANRVFLLFEDGQVKEFIFNQVSVGQRVMKSDGGGSYSFDRCFLTEKDAHYAHYQKLLAQAAELDKAWGFTPEASK